MVFKQKVRNKGKLQLSRYFQKLNEGESVAVVREPSQRTNFPERLQGRTGIVKGKKGKVYSILINDEKKEKLFLIEPIHLKKIKTAN